MKMEPKGTWEEGEEEKGGREADKEDEAEDDEGLDEEEQEAWGRPVDLLILDDGSMLISDDKADVIYRVTYKSQ